MEAAATGEEPQETWGLVGDPRMGCHTTEGLHCLKCLPRPFPRTPWGLTGGTVGSTFAEGSGSWRGVAPLGGLGPSPAIVVCGTRE